MGMDEYLSFSAGMNIDNIQTIVFWVWFLSLVSMIIFKITLIIFQPTILGMKTKVPTTNQRLDSGRHSCHFKIRMAVQSSSESPNPKVLQALRSKSKIDRYKHIVTNWTMGKKHDPNTILKRVTAIQHLSDSSCSSEQISKGLDMHRIFHMVIMPGKWKEHVSIFSMGLFHDYLVFHIFRGDAWKPMGFFKFILDDFQEVSMWQLSPGPSARLRQKKGGGSKRIPLAINKASHSRTICGGSWLVSRLQPQFMRGLTLLILLVNGVIVI